jgi:hypothetical protein
VKKYVVAWGRGNLRPGSTIAELDAALDEVGASGVPRVVGIYPPEHLDNEDSSREEELPPALQIGFGHPERSFVLWLGPEGGIGIEAGVSPWPDGAPDIAFDSAGDVILVGPDRTRVTPAVAREAAREFIRTRRRPTCLEWPAA